MHYLYFVCFPGNEAETSQDARTIARDILNNEGFANMEGYFSSGKADWFVVGGRWTGILIEILGKVPKFDEKHVQERIQENIKNKKFKNKKEKEKWIQSEILSYYRDTYTEVGYDDDAAILTKELIDALKNFDPKFKMKECEIFEQGEGESVVNDLSDKDIGKWIVVIDYHS